VTLALDPRRLGALLFAVTAAVSCGESSDDDAASGGTAGAQSGGGAPAGGGTSGGAGSAGMSSGGSAGAGGSGAAPTGPTRYPADAVASPIDEQVAAHLRAIAQADAGRTGNVFMKVGDSHTVNSNLLYCFSGLSKYQLDLAGRDSLMPSIEHFRKGQVGTTTPFDRSSLAASVGKTASWAINGSPSPLQQEMGATNARFAFVSYGTNDMQMGVTFASAAFPFYSNLSALLDQLEQAGIVPIVAGLLPRGDDASAALWAPVYDSITRGIAEAHQVPYLSVYLATKDLPGQGLGSDGTHGNVYVTGGSGQGCIFTSTALDYGYNVRNLGSIQQLDVVRRVVLDSSPAPDAWVAAPSGKGSASDPVVVDSLPFTHSANTDAGEKLIDVYDGCGSSADESGPERYYRFDVSETTPVRIMLFDRSGVDVDIHLLSGGETGAACLARNDRMIERTLAPGSYTLVVDSYVSSGQVLSGDYLLLVTRCDPADTNCQ